MCEWKERNRQLNKAIRRTEWRKNVWYSLCTCLNICENYGNNRTVYRQLKRTPEITFTGYFSLPNNAFLIIQEFSLFPFGVYAGQMYWGGGSLLLPPNGSCFSSVMWKRGDFFRCLILTGTEYVTCEKKINFLTNLGQKQSSTETQRQIPQMVIARIVYLNFHNSTALPAASHPHSIHVVPSYHSRCKQTGRFQNNRQQTWTKEINTFNLNIHECARVV